MYSNSTVVAEDSGVAVPIGVPVGSASPSAELWGTSTHLPGSSAASTLASAVSATEAGS